MPRHKEIIRLIEFAEKLGKEQPDLTDDEVIRILKKESNPKLLLLRKNMVIAYALIAAYRRGRDAE